MTDSQFLYQLMLYANEDRARQPLALPGTIVAAAGRLYVAIESGKDSEVVREEVIKIAAAALRYAVESTK